MKKKVSILFGVIFTIMFVGTINVNAAAPCKAISGDGTKEGNEIQCGTENFYVLKEENNNLVLLPKYNLKVGYDWITDSTKQELIGDMGMQSSECTGAKDSNFECRCCNKLSTFEDGTAENYLTNYSNYLKNTVKIANDITIKIPTINNYEEYGCVYNKDVKFDNGFILSDELDCTKKQSFLYSTSYFLSDKTTIYGGAFPVTEGNASFQKDYEKSAIVTTVSLLGVRPIVTINKANLNVVNNSNTTNINTIK